MMGQIFVFGCWMWPLVSSNTWTLLSLSPGWSWSLSCPLSLSLFMFPISNELNAQAPPSLNNTIFLTLPSNFEDKVSNLSKFVPARCPLTISWCICAPALAPSFFWVEINLRKFKVPPLRITVEWDEHIWYLPGWWPAAQQRPVTPHTVHC